MNYQKIYNQLCILGQSRILDGYVERHHVIPKCIGGLNSKDNITTLTAREHFVAHRLLTKIYPNNSKLHYAMWRMLNKRWDMERHVVISSRLYEVLRHNVSVAHKEYRHSTETKLKIQVAHIGKIKTAEHCKNISYSKKCQHLTMSREHRDHLKIINGGSRNGMYGKKHSLETLEKMRKSQIGKVISDVTRERQKNSRNNRALFYIMISPNGEKIEISNLKEFCRNYDLSTEYRKLLSISSGKCEYSHANGWNIHRGK